MADVSNIKIVVSQDKMSAFISVHSPEPGYTVKHGDITSALTERKVTHGIDNKEIDRIINDQVYDQDILVARGKQAVNGENGRLEYLFDLNDEIMPKVQPDGRVDYRDMNIVHPAYKGDVLCRAHAPTTGSDGFNVLGGALIAKKGKPVLLPRGRNTRLNETGDALISVIDGQIKRIGNKIDVVQEFEVKNNVDFSTGNIQFPGNVTVKGNVLSGFSIQSGGDVTIFGLVERASVTALGNIVLHGGMTGQGSGSLRAGGDIFAKYVENSFITASGKITAECIMHSNARAGVGIDLIGKKGLLVGGSAKAREYIRAVTIGSQFATLTEIEVGSDPKQNDRFKEIKAEIAALEIEQNKVDQALRLFNKRDMDSDPLPPQKALVYERTLQIYEEQTSKLVTLRAEHDNLENAVKRDINGFIRVSNYIYSGVKVSIANNNTLLNRDLQYCTLKSDGEGISVTPF